MKKIILMTLVGLLTLVSSCDEDYLVEDARDAIYADNLFENKTGFESSLNSVYAFMREVNAEADSKMTRGQLWTVNTDVVSTRTATISRYTATGSGFSDAAEAYEWLYQLINTTNLIINRAEGAVDWGGIDEAGDLAIKNEITGQARVARAWAYRLLIYAFGPVPLSVEEVNGANYSNAWSRNSIEEIKAQMKLDLEFAVEHLPLRGNDMTRINGAVARHFLGELNLSLGSFQEALDVLQPLCESGTYSLVQARFGSTAGNNDGNHFMDVVRNPYASSGNTETFFVFPNNVATPGSQITGLMEVYTGEYEDFLKMQNYGKRFGQDRIYATFGGYGKGRYLMTPYGVSNEKDYKLYSNNISADNNIDNWIWSNTDGRNSYLYEEGDIRGQNESIRRYFAVDWNENGSLTDPSSYPLDRTITEFNRDYNDKFNQGDTLYTHFQYGVNGDGAPSTAWKYGYPFSRKWEITESQTNNINALYSFHDVGYLRLADSYLLYAEAFMMLGNTGEAADWINKVRTRSNAPEISASQVTLDFLLDERARELITEEERRITLLRTGKLIERVKKYNPLSKYYVQNHHKLFALPATAILANKDKQWDQNDGYGGSIKVDFTPPGYPDEGDNP